MDISSLLSSSVPAYFVMGPLVVLVILLVVLAARKASPTNQVPVPQSSATPTAQASSIPAQTPPQPVATAQSQTTSKPVDPVDPVVPTAPPEIKQTQTVPTPTPVPVPTPAPVTPPVAQPQPVVTPETVPLATTPDHVSPVAPAPVTTGTYSMKPEPISLLQPEAEAKIPTVTPSSPEVSPTGTIPPINSWKPAESVVVPVDTTQSEAEMQAQAMALEHAPATPVATSVEKPTTSPSTI